MVLLPLCLIYLVLQQQDVITSSMNAKEYLEFSAAKATNLCELALALAIAVLQSLLVTFR